MIMDREELIKKYYKESLSTEETMEFSKLIKTDEDFKAKFEDYANFNKAFKANEAEDLKNFLRDLDSKEVKQLWYKKPVFYYAAAAVLIIALCVPLFTKTSTNNFYNDFYEAYPNVEQPIVRGSNKNVSYEAFLAYENANYSKSAQLFKSLLESSENINYRFYYAMALLNDSKYNKALEELTILETKTFDYHDETLWYAALILIKQEKIELAKSKLQQLENTKSKFKSKERQLLLEKL